MDLCPGPASRGPLLPSNHRPDQLPPLSSARTSPVLQAPWGRRAAQTSSGRSGRSQDAQPPTRSLGLSGWHSTDPLVSSLLIPTGGNCSAGPFPCTSYPQAMCQLAPGPWYRIRQGLAWRGSSPPPPLEKATLGHLLSQRKDTWEHFLCTMRFDKPSYTIPTPESPRTKDFLGVSLWQPIWQHDQI